MATVTPIQSANTIPSHRGSNSPATGRVPPGDARAGFLLLDSALNPISFNVEALQILGYSDDLGSPSPAVLSRTIRAKLLSRHPARQSAFVTEFRSGRRHYFCRVFPLNSLPVGPSISSIANIAVLLERGPSGFVLMPSVVQKFKLTRREQEVLELLLQGLDSKAIAARMRISPNTVKAFFRLIMTKMGVSSRSAIVVKLVMSQS